MRMFDGMMRTMATEAPALAFPPEVLKVDVLVERLRRRLNALVYGHDVRASTFKTREAPESIVVGELMFDRVMDNLLTNAAKYTHRGSIVVEVAGMPGFLTIKVSDSGRGMTQDQLSRIFQPSGSDENTRAAHSFGVGLSVVVQLLAVAGGKLEVMSKPEQGTTFWVHFPEKPATSSQPPARPVPAATRESHAQLVDRVVSIRKLLTN